MESEQEEDYRRLQHEEKEFIKLFKEVKEMRRLQSLYWDTKAFTLIDKVKKQEKYVDRLLFDINLTPNG